MNEENGMGKPAASEEAKQEADELAKAVADKAKIEDKPEGDAAAA